MIRIFSSPVDLTLPESPAGKNILSLLPKRTMSRIRALRNTEDTSRSLTAYSLLFQFLSVSHGVAPDDLVFEDSPHGKPELKIPEGICFNCAHAGQQALCAVSRFPVGADIEEISFSFDNSFYTFLHPREIKYLESFPDDLRNEKFLGIWTIKEAYLKALGCGLLRDPSTFSVVYSGQGKVYVEDPASPPGKTPWLMQKNDLPGYIAAVCLLIPNCGDRM